MKNTQVTLLFQYTRLLAVNVWTAVRENTVGVYSEDIPVNPIEKFPKNKWQFSMEDTVITVIWELLLWNGSVFSMLTCMRNTIKSSEVRPLITCCYTIHTHTYARTHTYTYSLLCFHSNTGHRSVHVVRCRKYTPSLPHRLRSHSRQNSINLNIKLIFVWHTNTWAHSLIGQNSTSTYSMYTAFENCAVSKLSLDQQELTRESERKSVRSMLN